MSRFLNLLFFELPWFLYFLRFIVISVILRHKLYCIGSYIYHMAYILLYILVLYTNCIMYTTCTTEKSCYTRNPNSDNYMWFSLQIFFLMHQILHYLFLPYPKKVNKPNNLIGHVEKTTNVTFLCSKKN